MQDVRPHLYEQYVSHFKTSQLTRDERVLREYWSWCRFKYLPALNPVRRDDPILEIGCGLGYILEFLRENGFTKAEGIDISREQVRIAEARGLRARTADVFRFLSRGKKHYGAIIAVDFVEHFTKQELLKLFPMIFRALRPGGVLMLQTPNGQGFFPGQVIYGDLTHQTIFAQDSMRQKLSMAGFHDLRFAETGPVPDSAEGRLRTVLWWVIRAFIRIVRQIEAKNSSKLWTESFICWCERP